MFELSMYVVFDVAHLSFRNKFVCSIFSFAAEGEPESSTRSFLCRIEETYKWTVSISLVVLIVAAFFMMLLAIDSGVDSSPVPLTQFVPTCITKSVAVAVAVPAGVGRVVGTAPPVLLTVAVFFMSLLSLCLLSERVMESPITTLAVEVLLSVAGGSAGGRVSLGSGGGCATAPVPLSGHVTLCSQWHLVSRWSRSMCSFNLCSSDMSCSDRCTSNDVFICSKSCRVTSRAVSIVILFNYGIFA